MTAAVNDITGDALKTKVSSEAYRNNYDSIFKKDKKMDFNKYQLDAMSFRLPSANHEYALMGLVGEVGELYSLLAKQTRDGGDVEEVRRLVKKELGDQLWFIAAIADDYGFKLADVAQGNIDKLSSRKQRGVIQGSGDER